MMKLGLIAANSRPVSFEMSQAACSASFLERRYRSSPLSLVIVELRFQSSSSNTPSFSRKDPMIAPTEDVTTARRTPAATADRKTLVVPSTAGSISSAVGMGFETKPGQVATLYVILGTVEVRAIGDLQGGRFTSRICNAVGDERRRCMKNI